jgi:hypothetical protein
LLVHVAGAVVGEGFTILEPGLALRYWLVIRPGGLTVLVVAMELETNG